MRKMLSMLLAAVLLLSMLPAMVASADEIRTENCRRGLCRSDVRLQQRRYAD